jgi:hypothetical protein
VILQSVSGLFILGSFYLNRDYISANICVNRFDAVPVCKGKCFLENKLKENGQKEQKLPNLKQKEIQLFCQKSFFSAFSGYRCEAGSGFLSSEQKEYHFDFLASVFHPPQTT